MYDILRKRENADEHIERGLVQVPVGASLRKLIIHYLNRNMRNYKNNYKYTIPLILLSVMFLWACNNVKIKKEYYPTGELKAKYRIENEELHGTYYEYYKSGSYKEQSIYQNGKLNGIRRVYYENGKLDFEASYKSGKKHGIYKEFSSEGKLLGEGYFKNDLQDSITRWFYPNGELEQETEFKNGLRHGKSVFYHENGHLKLDALLENDTTVYFKRYSKEGELEKEFRNIEIQTLSDTICVGDTCTFHIVLFGPQIDSLSAKIDISTNRPEFKDFYFQNNAYTFDTLFLNTGEYRIRVYCKYEDEQGYAFTDSLWVINCGNASNKLVE